VRRVGMLPCPLLTPSRPAAMEPPRPGSDTPRELPQRGAGRAPTAGELPGNTQENGVS